MTHHDEQPPADRSDQSFDHFERLLLLAGSRPPGDAERRQRVHDAAHRAWRDSIGPRTLRRWQTLGTLALAAAAVVIAVWLARRSESPTPVPPSSVMAARLTAATGNIGRLDDSRAPVRIGDEVVVGSAFETGLGTLATFSFTEGGEMRMNEGTVVRFTERRDFQIDRGAIYLDSGSRRGSLVVRTPVGIVRDVGTRFEVGMVDGSWRVRVRDGLVRYEGAVPHQAGGGNELIVEPDGRVVERAAPTFGADWAWVVRAAPAFKVEGQTLSAFLDWVERESGRQVVFPNDELRRRSSGTILHGSIAGLTVEEALDVILPTCGLVHRIESQRVIVTRLDRPAGGDR
jgi:ferric-dicitrate binding protein FerR (iron transport regulator)